MSSKGYHKNNLASIVLNGERLKMFLLRLETSQGYTPIIPSQQHIGKSNQSNKVQK